MTDTQTPDRKWASIGGREARMGRFDTQTARYPSQFGISHDSLVTYLSPTNQQSTCQVIDMLLRRMSDRAQITQPRIRHGCQVDQIYYISIT
jgi:hypothetical protein